MDMLPAYVTTKMAPLLRILTLLVLGIPLVFLVSKGVRLYIAKKIGLQPAVILGRILLYTGLIFIVLSILHEFGFHLNTLLGAAGIVGIAVGFASQTSVSNIISGLFIMMERPFALNDYIIIDNVTGQVLSIDLLSVKLRTEDNRFVRVPNEVIIKNKLTNITRFPIRRLDIRFGVAYKEDIQRIRAILLDIAHQTPLCLQEPEPQVILSGFGSSSVDFLFTVWATKTNLLTLQNTIQEEIKRRFDEEKIEIPYPHVSLYAGSATEAFPIRLVSEKSPDVS